MTITNLSRYMDAAILKPETTTQELTEAVNLCVANQAFAVVVKPADVPRAIELCVGSETIVCAVLSFPFGADISASKAEIAREVIAQGAKEIDMVANYGWALSGRWAEVEADIAAVVSVAKPAEVLVKVIVETAQLNSETISRFVEACSSCWTPPAIGCSSNPPAASATPSALRCLSTWGPSVSASTGPPASRCGPWPRRRAAT